MNIILAILLGVFFGFALYYVGATGFSNISKMLRLEDLSLAKIILFAIGFSSILLSISAMLGIFDISHLSIKSMNLGVIIGGLIFGIGFGLAGTCPGTCFGSLGGVFGIKKAISGVIGGLFGAFTFSISYGYFKELGLFNSLDYGKITLFNISDKYPAVVNVGYIGLLILGVLFMLGAYLLPEKILSE
ncbi:YeeE/YedE thiosulfate transporter family protein [Clostridium sp. D53t1_180928_C8]|uniref:YeeE/YedE thiosulfate transporter family protein n=1 Tax=Clostridium sp. D53t1_180928_C8 TaxID=2787101 RepID=UPI0018A9EF95|nr:YeeE/YedE thiosulfate transporter family protein [Clostridium sp. D53t1_180928_C8]